MAQATRKGPLAPRAFAAAGAVTVFVLDVVGYVWHGLLGQPSMENVLYPGFWQNPALLAAGLVLTVALGYALGWVFAAVYNRQAAT